MQPGRRRDLILLGVMLCVLAGAGCSMRLAVQPAEGWTPQAEAQYEFVLGQMAEQNQAWDTAEAAYRKGLKSDPASLTLWRELLQLLLQNGRPAQAVEEFQAVLSGHQVDPDWVLLMGEVEQAAGNTGAAESYLRQAAFMEPPRAEALAALGTLLLTGGDEAEGAVLLQKALQLDPRLRRARREIVQYHMDSGDYALAKVELDQALKTDPQDGEWLLWLGKLQRALRQDDQAIKTFSRVLEENPDEPEAIQALADFYLKRHQWLQAAEYLEKLARYRPADTLVMRNLGIAYFELGQWDRARDLLDELARLHREDAVTHFMLGSIYQRKGLWNLAVAELTEAARSAGLRNDAGLELAGVFVELGETQKAVEWLNLVRPDLPEDPARLYRYAVTAIRVSLHEDALAMLRRAKKLEPRNAKIEFQFGRAWLGMNRIPEALQAWRRAVVLDPKLAEAYNHLAYTCAEHRLHLKEAEAWAHRALELDPGNGNYHDTLGWVYYQIGNYAAALTEMQRALACFGSQPESWDPVVCSHLGDIYNKLNRPSEALEFWNRALKANPDDAALQEKIKAHSK